MSTFAYGVDILIGANNDKSICAVKALRDLFAADPQPLTAPLFRLENRPFKYSLIVPMFQDRLRRASIPNPEAYRGHSFRRGAAQYAIDNGLLESHVQLLGRWSSLACREYYSTNESQLLSLSKRFQTGLSPTLLF